MTEMMNELILIRHGKAEPRGEAADDAQRKLTKNGTEDLKKILPELKSHMDPELKPALCSSPLLRALQTAEMIADHFGISEIEQSDWIEKGGYAELGEKLNQLEPPSALIVVGHEPYLSSWSREFSGFTIPFRKGTAAGFRILSTEPLRAEPIWMVLPETVGRQELSIRKSQPAPREFQKLLRFQIHEVYRMLQVFLNNPEDPETAHQFRVKTRAFRSLLSFIKPQLNQDQYQRAEDLLEKLSQGTVRLREIDVIKSEWTKLMETHPEVMRPKSVLTAVLTSERQKELKEIRGSASWMLSAIFDIWNWIEKGFQFETAEADSEAGTEAPCAGTPAAEITEAKETPAEIAEAVEAENDQAKDKKKTGKILSLEDFSRKRTREWMKKADVQLKGMDYNDPEAVHSLRIQFKKLRYVLDALNPLLHLESKAFAASLAALQDVLGTYCDIERNLFILKEFDVKYAPRGIRQESGILGGYQIRLSEEKLREMRKLVSSINLK
jgi:phosphohistidine phosphatase SixA/CHAD domain-containing protein